MREQVYLECIDELFRIAGYDSVTHQDILDDPDWKNKYTMTSEQFKQWYAFCAKQFSEKFNIPEAQATQETALFVINYGIKCK
jgi:hypothetical protein